MAIVGLIEKRLKEAPKYRIPVLYLIDHIIKDFPEEYVHHFSVNLVKLFAETFKHSSPDPDRKKLYELRTTWDDVFPPKILYELDSTVKKIDKKWPVRVTAVKQEQSSRTPHSQSSDEFSHSETDSETRSTRSRQHQHTADESSKAVSNTLNVGCTGAAILPNNGSEQARTRTPSSVSSPNNVRSRPPSTVSDDAAKSTTALDERLSLIERASRAQSLKDSEDSDDNALVISTPPPTKLKEQSRKKSFHKLKKAPSAGRVSHPSSGISSPVSQTTSLSGHKSRGLNEILNGISSNNRRLSVLERPSITPMTNSTGVDTTTRAIQTSQYTRDMGVLTEPVGKKDASTQKKLRKPKQAHFGHQFSGRAYKIGAGVQATKSTKDSYTQWRKNDTENSKELKGFEFRAAVMEKCEIGCKRMTDTIMRRLHQQQQSGDASCDLTLSGADGHVKAHKIVIAAVSEYVAQETIMTDEIRIGKMTQQSLQSVISYIYTQVAGPFGSNDELMQFLEGADELKIRQLDILAAQIKEGVDQGKSYVSSAITGTELIKSSDSFESTPLKSPGVASESEPPTVTPQASDLDDDALMALAKEIVVPGDKKKQKQATPVPRKLEAEKEKTPSTRARRSRVMPPREDSSEESSGPEDRLTSPLKPRVLKKRKQESAKSSEDRPKRIRRGNTPEPTVETTTPSRPQRTRGGPTSASRSRKTEPSEPKLPDRLTRDETPKGRQTRREGSRATPKVEKTEPKTIKREQRKENLALVDVSVKLKSLDPTLDYSASTVTQSKRKETRKSKTLAGTSSSESDEEEPTPAAKAISSRPKRRRSLSQTEDAAKENELLSQKLASKVLAEGEQSDKSTPTRAVRASARASRTPKPAAEKKTQKASSLLSDRSSTAAVPTKTESATRATRSKSPATVSNEGAEQKEQFPEIKTGKIEEPDQKEKKTERPTRRKTMPPLSKSEKAPATRAPTTPKVPSRQTQNKVKNDYHWPAEVEEILQLPIDEFYQKTGFNMRVLYLAHVNEKRLQADTS
ncbi:unnamed protein product [Oikopleura dioica]|uniref:CID domain-containing protein n=2 Tax=Oikopleura dioica TaxID=34765 RepID=E4Y0B2_OIKDI|nr:unnamed protein product [Oikopleura dioica]